MEKFYESPGENHKEFTDNSEHLENTEKLDKYGFNEEDRSLLRLSSHLRSLKDYRENSDKMDKMMLDLGFNEKFLEEARMNLEEINEEIERLDQIYGTHEEKIAELERIMEKKDATDKAKEEKVEDRKRSIREGQGKIKVGLESKNKPLDAISEFVETDAQPQSSAKVPEPQQNTVFNTKSQSSNGLTASSADIVTSELQASPTDQGESPSENEIGSIEQPEISTQKTMTEEGVREMMEKNPEFYSALDRSHREGKERQEQDDHATYKLDEQNFLTEKQQMYEANIKNDQEQLRNLRAEIGIPQSSETPPAMQASGEQLLKTFVPPSLNSRPKRVGSAKEFGNFMNKYRGR